ncbi:MAG TPA: PASTA domain-containing protein [Pyrinomonadaceae bacterium]|nr:PASTA domain-containing protein [Pyrinomonadaceae bacterium]
MSFFKKIGSALGKLLIVACLAAAFLLGMGYVVYRSLQGSEITVPEIVGKNYADSEKELEGLGLRIKKRADRYSEEAPNTVLEQLPKPGDTVKTGQLILVITSKPNPEGDEKPTTLKKGNTSVEEDDTEKIEELISDKPKKKSNSNTNTNKKKASTSRDVIKDNSNSDTNSSTGNKNSSDPNNSTKDNKNGSTPPAKTPNPTGTPKPTTNKTPATSGDTRPRRNP